MNPPGLINTCKSCGNQFTGIYCNLCGEKVLLPADRSFKKFLSNILLAITFADNRFVKTLWLVVKRPGFVSTEFAEGRTTPYLKPLSLFFLLNLIYFFFPVIQLFNATLNTQLLSFYGPWIKEMVARQMVAMHLDLSAFSLVYNIKSTSLAKLMVMLFVVIASLPLNLLYSGRGRFFTDHVGFAVELACFNLFVNTIVLTLLLSLFGLGKYVDEYWLTGIFIVTNLYFLVRAGRAFYGEQRWRLAVKSVAMILFLKVALEVYRAILFFVTLWSL
jgi:hypothetical protein